MQTNSGNDGGLHCDKCGRPIPSSKGYLEISGWIICGICQYEDSQKYQLNKFFYDPSLGFL